MIIAILKGKTELIERTKNPETIQKGCPDCNNDLLLKQFRTWSTIFFVPTSPTTETRSVYECGSCSGTFDPAYRKTFINRGKYLGSSAGQIHYMAEHLSLLILAAVLSEDGKLTEKEIKKLYEFGARLQTNRMAHIDEVKRLTTATHLTDEVLEQYDIFRDCFIEAIRKDTFIAAVNFIKTYPLAEKESKLLYTLARHWGFSKDQYEIMIR